MTQDMASSETAEHQLAAWISREGRKRRDFATSVGTSESFLSLVLNGKKGVSLALACEIERETRGEVTPAVLQSEFKRLKGAAIEASPCP